MSLLVDLGWYSAVALVFLVLGVLTGVFATVYLHRDEMRETQRGVDEARLMLLAATGTDKVGDAVDQLTSAGLWPPADSTAGPLSAVPTHSEGR